MVSRRLVRAASAAGALLLALTVATPAWCEPTAADKATARALLKEGDAARAKGDLKAALKSYMGAHAIMGLPTTGVAVGKAQADQGLLVEAVDTLLAVTRMPVKPDENDYLREARASAQTLSTSIAARIPSIKLVLAGVADESAAKVTSDGHEVVSAAAGLPRKVNPGSHVLVVRVGTDERRAEVSVAEGENRDVKIDFGEPASSDPVAKAPEGADTNTTTTSGTSNTVTHDAGAPSTMSPLVYVGFGTAAAFLIGGTVTGLVAMSKAKSAKDGCIETRCPPSTYDDIDTSKRMGTISTIAFVVAGVGVGVGVLGLLSAPSPAESTTKTSARPHVTPWIGLGTVGVSGAF